jgi:hypothetical protein
MIKRWFIILAAAASPIAPLGCGNPPGLYPVYGVEGGTRRTRPRVSKIAASL